jgi:hypothetical protein
MLDEVTSRMIDQKSPGWVNQNNFLTSLLLCASSKMNQTL